MSSPDNSNGLMSNIQNILSDKKKDSIKLEAIQETKTANKNVIKGFDKAKGRGRPKGVYNTSAEQDLTCEIIIDLMEGAKQERTQDKTAKFNPKLRGSFEKAWNRTATKYKLEMLEKHPEKVLIGIVVYMIIDVIGKENVFKVFKLGVDKVNQLCAPKTA